MKILKDKMNSMIKLEDIFIVRLIPVFIKDLVLKIACNIENEYQTMTLSNFSLKDFLTLFVMSLNESILYE